MSKKTNRNVRTLPFDDLDWFQHPRECFGEEINYSDDSLDSLLGIRDLGTGKSSSSSLSWGEEYKSEAAKQVENEFHRMDRILQGIEPIPSNYDRNEYEEWMEFFPNLCINGLKTMKRSATIPPSGKSSEDYEEIFAMHPEESPKTPVNINQIYPQTSANKPPNKIVKKRDAKPAPRVINIDDYLKISPMISKDIVQRQPSSRSLISSHISSSKWLKDDDDYNSLPFLVNNLHVQHRKEVQTPKSILKNGKTALVLPPIQQRSVSATPRRSGKTHSTLSSGVPVRTERRNTSRFHVNNSITRKAAGLRDQDLCE